VIGTVKLTGSARIELSRRYTLPFGTRVIPRADDCVQIGTESPRCVVVRDAPRESVQLLGALDGASTIAEVLTAHDADPLMWSGLLGQLMAADLLVPVEPTDRTGLPAPAGAHLTDERAGLAHRHGHVAAARILQARDDSLIVVRGAGAVARSIASLLAAAGVGHLHCESGGPALRPRTRTSTDTAGPRPADVGASLRSSYPTLRVHPPAAHQHPTIVVLAGDAVPDLGMAAAYTRSRIPHLAVTTGVARAVVGPLVLPGRSSCLSCAHRHRTAADPGWPAVARQLTDDPQRAPAFLAAAAACLAVGEVLEHIDGVVRPTTVNGTLEWHAGDLGPRRRTWTQHPQCGCSGS